MSMTPEKVVETVESCGVPCAHRYYPEGSVPALPWAVYYLDESTGFCADNKTHERTANWIVELYEARKDPELENRLLGAIESAFSPCRIYESWIEDDESLMFAYHFTEI